MYKEIIKKEITESIGVKARLLNTNEEIEKIGKVAQFIIDAYKKGCKVVLFGNGGSAADAQHIAAELVGKFKMERDGFPAIAFTTNSSIVTSIGNDYDFKKIFARQSEAFVCKGDIVIGISTSGNASNVVEGIKVAKKKGAITIGFTGSGESKLSSLVDLCIKVPSNDTPHIQESHITIGHIICSIVEREMIKK